MSNQMLQSTSVKGLLGQDSVRRRFEEVLGARAPQFCSSMISLANTKLTKCDPMSVITSCMVAATLDLPINPTLGFAHIVPYGGVAQFQIGYKGLVQLAIRSGEYKHINAFPVYEGQVKGFDKLTGEIELDSTIPDGEPDDAVSYVAFLETVSGYRHTVLWTRPHVEAHALRFSPAFKKQKKDSPWFTDFNAMAIKTALKDLITHWGPMSVQVQSAVTRDNTAQTSFDEEALPAEAIEQPDPDDDSEKGVASLGPSTEEEPPQDPPAEEAETVEATLLKPNKARVHE